MRSPEHRNNNTNRTSQNYKNELSSRYKTPEAFTVLPPDDEMRQDPPAAPQPYRLTPSAKRHKNMSFAILAEPTSVPGSRSPSPTGRVSPFRGRGFNPIGSRHASPNPSPPPQESFTPLDDSPRHSKIPRLTRRGSATIFGEKVTDYQLSPNRRKLNAQLSQSLTNIAPRKVSSRPPPSPRRPPGYSKQTFQRLSPIVGSSPEPSQSQSSPKINNNSNQQSKYTSPGRSRSFVNKPRPSSKVASRNASREPSPSKNPTSPTRIPVKNYRNVQAKVNSFSRKPKVPPKPQVLSEETTEDSADNLTNRRKIPLRRDSVKSRTNSKSNLISTNNNNNTNSNNKNSRNVNKDTNGNNVNSNKSKIDENKGAEKNKEKTISDKEKTISNKGNNNNKTNQNIESTSENSTKPTTQEEPIKKSESSVKLSDLLQPSTTTVVSTTTTTVTQPLKIEAKIDPELTTKTDNNKNMAPIVDGRILSATSVSNAMNKMNDTVLTSQTLMKESGLTKLSPAANTIIAMSKTETKPENPALDTKNATTALPQVPSESNRTIDNVALNNINSNHVTSTGILPSSVPSSKVLEQHVQNNMSKMLTPENKVINSVSKSANDRIIEARTVIAHDVKPIKITVKEKPMDVEVQSGNIRFDTVNGINERPSLPPPQQPSNDPQQPEEPPKGNACTRFLRTCKTKMSCNRCKKPKNESKEELKKVDAEDKEKTGCFNCKKQKPEGEGEKDKTGCFGCRKKKPDITINVENTEPKKTLWDRLKCWGKNKVSDNSSCLPLGKRKDSWVGDRRDSILSELPKTEKARGCMGFLRRIFCCDKCKKKRRPKLEEIPDSRRTSMMSKKKSLTPPVVEEQKPKLDSSLVDYTSHMKAAIPVLPVYLAWFCLVMNCIAPGTGTVFSGLFCLCIGIPRFSQKDGYRQRIGSFLINLIIGFGQFFTVLFCLVGWGWSIWWGVIMVKLAKKHRKIKALEANAQEATAAANQNNSSRDPERGS